MDIGWAIHKSLGRSLDCKGAFSPHLEALHTIFAKNVQIVTRYTHNLPNNIQGIKICGSVTLTSS